MWHHVEPWRLNVHEYHRMAEVGIFREGDPVELLDGVLIRKPKTTARHAACTSRLSALFHKKLYHSAIVSTNNPVRLGEMSEPEPEVKLLKWRDDFYSLQWPGPADVLLVVEIADSSLDLDRKVKLPLYAYAAVVEVWLVNVRERCVETYSQPMGRVYQTSRTVRENDCLTPVSFPQLSLRLDEIVGSNKSKR